MGKRAQSRRLSVAARTPQRPEPGSGRRVSLGVVAGVVLIVAAGLAVAAIAFAATLSTSGSGSGSGSLPPGTQTFAETDHTHVSGTVKYDRVPPAGGPHNPVQLNCGVYTEAVPNENAVHSLEHGAVWITYQPTLPPDQLAALQQLAVSNYVGSQRYMVLSPYAGIPSPIVASAWGAQLGVDSPSDSRLLAFIQHFAGGGQGGEQGGPCTGGVGTPAE